MGGGRKRKLKENKEFIAKKDKSKIYILLTQRNRAEEQNQMQQTAKLQF